MSTNLMPSKEDDGITGPSDELYESDFVSNNTQYVQRPQR